MPDPPDDLLEPSTPVGLLLRQILVNLVGNALKFTEEGEIVLKIDPLPGVAGGIAIQLRDTGIGIPRDKWESIFESFTQVDPSITRRYGGTGLGLAIVRSLVERMGGEIRLDSQLGRGSTFSFDLRLEPGTPPPSVAGNEPARNGAASGTTKTVPEETKGASVLVAEDNPLNRKLMGILLQQLGCAYKMVGNGAEALEALDGHPWDMLFLDLQMPVMDGFETIRVLREERGSSLPVVALTACVFQEDQDRCREAGMDGYLAKPVTREGLRSEISRWRNQKSSRKD